MRRSGSCVIGTASLAGVLGLLAVSAYMSGCLNATGTIAGGEQFFEASGSAVVVVDAAIQCTPPSGDAGVVTFTRVYSEIINSGPSCNGCHTPAAGPTGNLDMSSQATAYMNLVSKPPTSAKPCNVEQSTALFLVDPGKACTSLMYLKVTNPPCGVKMPASGPPYLTQAQSDLVGGWINAGAKND